MKRAAFCTILIFICGCAPAALAQPALTVTKKQAVNVVAAVPFWDGGTLVKQKNLVVIWVTVAPKHEFIPRNISAPLFVLGSKVCIVVKDPVDDGKAILIVPRAAAAERLWLTRAGVLDAKLKEPLLTRLRNQAIAAKRTALIPPPGAATATFADWDQLVAAILVSP